MVQIRRCEISTNSPQIIGQKRVLSLVDSLLSSKDTIMPHILLHGPAGTGKTTIATYISEQQVEHPPILTSGPITKRPGDLIKLMLKLKKIQFYLSTRFMAFPYDYKRCYIIL